MNIVVFLNVEYDYLKKQDEKRNENNSKENNSDDLNLE